jgi:XTP/dITP diphosphohydrolase
MGEQILIATRSAGKVRELRPLLQGAGYTAVSLDDVGLHEEPIEQDLESFDSFEENALAKARHFRARSGLTVMADDSGLEVLALGRRPGVLSKRWSGRGDLSGDALDEANNRHLVAQLDGISDRRARYVCVAAFSDGVRELACRGEVEGEILLAPRGNGGFGYDPYFFSTELGRTFGEASREEKERVSHRARAFHALVAELRAVGSRR